MRRAKPRYKSPRKPWESKRIKEENEIVKGYGLANKREIWKTADKLRNWREQAKNIVSVVGLVKDKHKKILLDSLAKFGIVKQESDVEEILDLTMKDLLERRLQTVIYRKGFARTVKQARQFIVHNKVLVNGRKVNAPSYLVRVDDEIKFVEGFEPNTEVVKEVVQSESSSVAPRAESTTDVKEIKTESVAEVKE
ncbi:MAG: 30S ribosomal protein S4 [DPANN group archaeon]|nr:30S ribosomal protein S4 [DPANN group archaeon]